MNIRAYGALAAWYDGFTRDVPYAALADYYETLLRGAGREGRMLLLDLCCGTGAVTLPLAERGHELIGVDHSPEMLSQAAAKAARTRCEIAPMFLCQEAGELDLYGTVEGAFCALDGMNYLPPEELDALLRRLHLFLEPGGVFAFDIHSPEHLRALDGGVFVDETEDALCLWRGAFDMAKNALVYGMDIFARNGGERLWRRSQEEHVEYAHAPGELNALLLRCGFAEVETFAGGPFEEEDRLFFRAVNLPH